MRNRSFHNKSVLKKRPALLGFGYAFSGDFNQCVSHLAERMEQERAQLAALQSKRLRDSSMGRQVDADSLLWEQGIEERLLQREKLMKQLKIIHEQMLEKEATLRRLRHAVPPAVADEAKIGQLSAEIARLLDYAKCITGNFNYQPII